MDKVSELEDDYPDEDPDAVEAARWAQEQLEKSKKKDSDVDREAGKNTDTQVTGYVQNAEQSNETIWQRVKNVKN